MPAILKYRSIAVRIFLTKKGLPVFVRNKVGLSDFGRMTK